jgi:hypothetical protein
MSTTEQRLDMVDCVGSQLKARGLGSRYDANETATFARELEWLQAEAVEMKYVDLTGLQLVPLVGGSVPAGARTHAYRELDGFGEAEMLDTMTPEEFGTAEIRGAEVTGKFRPLGTKYIYTIEDLRARPSLSFDVGAERAKIARRVIEEKLDRLVFGNQAGTGDAATFPGLINDGSSTDDTAAAGTPDWESGVEATDVAAILATFRAMVKGVTVDTKGIYDSLDFVVSIKQWNKLALFVPSTTVGGGTTVASFLLQHVPGVRSISKSPRLDAAGASSKDRILGFPRDPDVLDCLVPTRFEQFAPQLTGMAFTTFCAAKYGGLRLKQKKAIRRADVTMT